MRVLSVCSGAGGLDLGLERAGCRTVALCERVPWLRELLAARFPDVPCWPDLTELDPADLPAAELLAGGTPCQDLSVTGQRGGLDGAKSRLFFDFIRVRNTTGVRWALWENVEGALSSNGGLDFACVLGAFVGADVAVPAGGWPGAGVVAGPWGGACWRVLDAQHFGVPQRRKRVFVVGRLGGPCPPEILLEPNGGAGHTAPRHEAAQDDPRTLGVRVAGALGALTGGSRTTDLDGHGAYVASALTAGGPGRLDDQAVAQLVAVDGRPSLDADRMRAADGMAGRVDGAVTVLGSDVTHTLTAEGHDASEDGTGRGTPIAALTVVGVSENQRGEVRTTPYLRQLTTGGGKPGQGYPLVAIDGTVPGADRCAFDPRPDSRRLSACGNGVVEPVAEWIGRRILAADGAWAA
jgi:DNA (cytosine-5)-methyltransferase 1